MGYSVLNGTKFRTYVTIEGDRFDTIAYKAYGDATKFAPIIEANFGVPLKPSLPAGVTLMIPIIETEESTQIELLPPWKRIVAESTKAAIAAVPSLLNPQTAPTGSFDDSFD
jgi:phage tail protein X